MTHICGGHDSAKNRQQAALGVFETHCRENSVRLTPIRRQVYAFILKSAKPVGAYDILASLTIEQQKCIAPPTVYRALEFLLEQGAIHRVASLNAYMACCHLRASHHAVLLICQTCEHVQESELEVIAQALTGLTQETGFLIDQTLLEIQGICRQCQLHATTA